MAYVVTKWNGSGWHCVHQWIVKMVLEAYKAFWIDAVALIILGYPIFPEERNKNFSSFAGNAPIVIAKGGFSGLFPDSSLTAYSVALLTSLTDVVMWCDVQLMKDGSGICVPDVFLDNCTDITMKFKDSQKTYLVNSVPVKGYFSVDYSLEDLSNVSCKLSWWIVLHFVNLIVW